MGRERIGRFLGCGGGTTISAIRQLGWGYWSEMCELRDGRFVLLHNTFDDESGLTRCHQADLIDRADAEAWLIENNVRPRTIGSPLWDSRT